jgi:shikimate dehydrogenase
LIHRFWLEQYGLAGAYDKEAVSPEDLSAFLGGLKAQGYVGANVTLPHKEAALRLAAVADEAARTIGAANTLWLDDAGRHNASNTDAYGLKTNLNAGAPGWNEGRRPAMVLGAGGAGRAVLHGLLAEGASRILLANRTADRARELADAFGPAVTVVDWRERNRALSGCGLLVNATSLGMTGKEALDLDLASLPSDAVVTDLVYSPLETHLLAAARARGNRAVDGLGMLLHQAVPGFERWFGVRPAVTSELRAHVAASLGGA